MGTALLCLALIAAWFLGWVPSGGMFVLAGSLLYLVGIIGVTMFFNVPMNNALAAVEPGQQRRCGAVEGLPRQLDDVEPCPHDCRHRRTGLVDDRFPRLSEGRQSVAPRSQLLPRQHRVFVTAVDARCERRSGCVGAARLLGAVSAGRGSTTGASWGPGFFPRYRSSGKSDREPVRSAMGSHPINLGISIPARTRGADRARRVGLVAFRRRNALRGRARRADRRGRACGDCSTCPATPAARAPRRSR